MGFKVLLTLIMLLALQSPALASTLLISDIDDTLKASQSNSRLNSILLSTASSNLIKGMSSLYNHLSKSYPGLNFAYVSAAPEPLMLDNHQDFLQKNHFPNGEIYLRNRLASSFDFKVDTIRNLIVSKPNLTKLIMVGDNGQADAQVFAQITEDFPDLKSSYYIRSTYPVKPNLTDSGLSFVSPIEICMGLNIHLNINCSNNFLKETLVQIVLEEPSSDVGTFFFHPYMNCRRYTWPFENLQSPFLEVVKNILLNKCSR